MKKFMSALLSIILMCSCIFNVRVCAAETVECTNTSSSVSIDVDDEIIAQFKIPINNSNQTQAYVSNPEYIVFTMTRSAIYWSLVGFPNIDNWWFYGHMNVVNVTSGLYDGQNQVMMGTSGSVGYTGYAGNVYSFTFTGTLYFTANGTREVYEKCSGGTQWAVPSN